MLLAHPRTREIMRLMTDRFFKKCWPRPPFAPVGKGPYSRARAPILEEDPFGIFHLEQG